MITAKELSDSDKKTGCSTKPQYSAISEHSFLKGTPDDIGEWLTSLRGDSRVNRSALQESKQEKTTPGICGPKPSSASESSNRDTLSLKTSPVCFLQNRVWTKSQGDLFHTALPFSGTWPKQGMMQDGRCWVQTMLGPDTGVRGSGFWLTPSQVNIAERSQESWEKRVAYRKKIGRNGVGFGCLAEQVKASKGRKKPITYVPNQEDKWATPTKMDSSNIKAERKFHPGGGQHPPLCQQVKGMKKPEKWPTPMSSDSHGASNVSIKKGNPKYRLREEVHVEKQTSDQKQGQLNPDWVEWLMGWPIGWSSLDPITELIWLDWSVDPADLESELTWPTPRMDHEGGITEAFNDGKGWYRTNKNGVRWGVKLRDAVASAKKAERKWPTPIQGDAHLSSNPEVAQRRLDEGKITLSRDVQCDSQSQGIIPRVAIGIKDRVNRLKAIGNGQVPQVAATAWRILS